MFFLLRGSDETNPERAGNREGPERSFFFQTFELGLLGV